MLTAGTVLLLGSIFVSSVHGSAELNVALEDYDDMMMGMKLKPVNDSFGPNKYHIPALSGNWVDAVSYCAKIGGVLADVRSPAELEFLQRMCRKSDGGRYAQWVGGASIGTNDTYAWIVDKTKVGKELWKNREPIRTKGNCVVLVWSEGPPGLAAFDCNKNKDRRAFICKFLAK